PKETTRTSSTIPPGIPKNHRRRPASNDRNHPAPASPSSIPPQPGKWEYTRKTEGQDDKSGSFPDRMLSPDLPGRTVRQSCTSTSRTRNKTDWLLRFAAGSQYSSERPIVRRRTTAHSAVAIRPCKYCGKKKREILISLSVP